MCEEINEVDFLEDEEYDDEPDEEGNYDFDKNLIS